MQEKFVMSEQQLRDMALNAMLIALDAQSAALHSMDKEHSLGLENGFSIDVLRQRAKDLVQATHVVVKCADILELREKLKSLVAASRRLKDEADRFRIAGKSHAKQRYEQLLLWIGDTEGQAVTEKAAQEAVSPNDIKISSKSLSSQAGKACLHAEIDECEAFSLQVHAICNLALEYALNAALKASCVC